MERSNQGAPPRKKAKYAEDLTTDFQEPAGNSLNSPAFEGNPDNSNVLHDEDPGDYIHYLTREYFTHFDRFTRYHEITEQYYVSGDELKLKLAPKSRFLVTSHPWETASDPDPLRSQYRNIKCFLEKNPSYGYVFYDYSSIPQKERETDENGRFSRDENGDIIAWPIVPNKTKEEAKAIFRGILLQTDDIYCGITFGKDKTSVINLAVNKLYLKRTWPYYEVFCAVVYGTLVDGPSILPIIEFCKALLQCAYGSSQTFKVLRELIRSQTYRTYKLDTALTTLEEKLYAVVESRYNEYYSTTPEDLLGADAVQTYVKEKLAAGPWACIDTPNKAVMEVLKWYCKQKRLHETKLSLPGDVMETAEVSQTIKDVLIHGLLSELLLTNVTNQSDRDAIICKISRPEVSDRHFNQFMSKFGNN